MKEIVDISNETFHDKYLLIIILLINNSNN